MIVTKRLTIRPTRGDREALAKQVSWLNDPETVQYSEQRHEKHTVDTQAVYVSTGGFHEIYYGNDMVGTIKVYTDRPNSVSNVGILIGKKYWGDGLGSEAWAGFCDHLLHNGTRKIEAGMMSINRGMIKVCQKTGMYEEGRLLDRFYVDEMLVDQVNYGKFR